MGKKILFESSVHQTLRAAERLSASRPDLAACVDSWTFTAEGAGKIAVAWTTPKPGAETFAINTKLLYARADSPILAEKWREERERDSSMVANAAQFEGIARTVFEKAGLSVVTDGRIDRERDFHDGWAATAEADQIDVIKSNEACTAPEMRYITQALGPLNGRRVLDVGCGLGEASVYFAIRGAEVTALDLSNGMLETTSRLARKWNVRVETHLASAETPALPAAAQFDVIYLGNLLHHVEIEKTVDQLVPHLSSEGVFVSWDPVAYNPVINVYRRRATEVRTPDEHPLTRADLRTFKEKFGQVETRFFWLTTLFIFIVMAFVQRRNPNKVRYWKAVVEEADQWRWLYRPLEFIDRCLLAIIPPLGWWCWNVVVIARYPQGRHDGRKKS